MLESKRPSVASPAYIIVLSVQRQIGALWKTSRKLLQRNGWGQSAADSAWLSVIRAVSVMKKKGARNAIETAIKRLWFATAIRKRRRRTDAGGFRFTNGIVSGTLVELNSPSPDSAPSAAS